jgi:hypothetical protein
MTTSPVLLVLLVAAAVVLALTAVVLWMWPEKGAPLE